MATNFYLNHYQNRTEQNLIESLTIESIKMYGMDMVYLPRKMINVDELFGEDLVTKFNSHRLIEMYIESVDGFEGGHDMMAKFGLQITNQATLLVSKRRFEHVMDMVRPREGDLIYVPLSNSLFEINHVEHENPFYQAGKLYSFKLTIEAFTYSHESFDTGIDEIDEITDNNSIEATLERSDNIEVQRSADEVVVRNDPANSYPTIDDDLSFNNSNPFGDL